MTDLDHLFREIAREQDELRAESDGRDRVRENLEALEIVPNRRSRFLLALGVAASLAFALGGVVGFMGDSRALRVTVGEAKTAVSVGDRLAAPKTRPLPLSFSDGTRIEMAPGARAHLAEVESDGARIVLESGRAHVEVVHRRGSRWNLSAGPFTVRVTGTRFDLAYSPEDDALELNLTEGQVELSGCVFGAGRRLAAGQTVRASCKRQHVEITFGDAVPHAAPSAAKLNGSQKVGAPASGAAPSRAPAEVTADARGLVDGEAAADVLPESPASAALDVPSEPKRAQPIEPAAAERVWLMLAKKGMYPEAFAAAEAGGFDAECKRSRPSELALLGDAARHSGNREKAAQAFLLLRRKFPGTSEAALAAFALGRLEFDVNGAYARAAQWFRTYLNEQREGALSREALGRLIESLYRAGDELSARELAVTYLRDYPAGPHADLSSRIVSGP